MAIDNKRTSRPLSTRKLDAFYIFFIGFSILLAFALDFVPFYPVGLPSWVSATRNWYIAEYNDPLYVRDPPFFQLFMWLELFFLVPVGAVIIGKLINDDKLASLYLLVWSTYYVTSTAVCFSEMFWAKDWPREYITKNAPGYILFGGIGTGILFDSLFKVKKVLLEKEKST